MSIIRPGVYSDFIALGSSLGEFVPSSGVSLAFTSASSSTSATYPAVVEGTAGQTVELFKGGVSQGSMTESPSGTYSKSVTLDSLSNDLTVKVNGVEYASQSVLSYAYWQDNGSEVFMGGVPESSWATSALLSGGTVGRTFANRGVGIHANTVVRTIRLNSGSSGAQTAKVKHLRYNGSTWDVLAEQSFSSGAVKQDVALATPWNMNLGTDCVGLYLSNSSTRVYAVNYQTKKDVIYDNGDKTGSGVAFTLSITEEMEIETRGDRASLGIAGDSITGASTNWQTPYDLYETAQNVIPGGNFNYEIGSLIEDILGAGLRWINYSHGGMTFAYAASTAFPRLVAADVHTAVLAYGVNDIATSRTWANVEANLDTIKTAWDASNIERLYICEILPWTAGNDTQAATIRTWNGNLATWCAANGVTLIETHDAFGQTRVSTGELDDLKTAYDSDGVHLTEAGMAALAAIIATYL